MFKSKSKSATAKRSSSTPTPAPTSPSVPKKELVVENKTEKEHENVINKGTVIEGNVVAEGNILLSGKVIGDVSTKAKITIDKTAYIKGNVSAENADIAGSVEGTVTVSGLLTIRQSSKIDGDVNTKNLNVESGALFTGRLNVGESKPVVSSPKVGGDKKKTDATTPVDSVLD